MAGHRRLLNRAGVLHRHVHQPLLRSGADPPWAISSYPRNPCRLPSHAWWATRHAVSGFKLNPLRCNHRHRLADHDPVGGRQRTCFTSALHSRATVGVVATLEELEARVAALKAAHADCRTALAAVNALAAEVKTELRGIHQSAEDNLAELTNLIVGPRDT